MFLSNWFKKNKCDECLADFLLVDGVDNTIGHLPSWEFKKINNIPLTEKEEEYKKKVEEQLGKLVIGQKDNSGYLITKILTRSDEYVIYEVQTDIAAESIRTYILSIIEEDSLLINRYSKIRIKLSEIRGALYKVNDESTYRIRIANIISHALSSGEINVANRYLTKLQKEMDQVYSERIGNSLKYLFTIIAFTVLFVLASMFVYFFRVFLDHENVRLILFTITAGCIGGFFSVSIRLRKMSFEKQVPKLTYYLYGFERIFISICASIIVLLAIKGEVAFSFTDKYPPFSSLLIAVASGFSETLIPNLLVKIENENK